jgi:UDP-3-O-[3-hydroxymyristoyl] glucosamine N-acyltransferase
MNNEPKIIQSQIKNVKFGRDVKIIEPVNIYECEIGDNTFIGPFVEIQKNVIIGKNYKIQSHSFICELVAIWNHRVVAHGDTKICGCRYNNNENVNKDIFNIGNAYGENIINMYNKPKVKELKQSFYMEKIPIECKLCSWYEGEKNE